MTATEFINYLKDNHTSMTELKKLPTEFLLDVFKKLGENTFEAEKECEQVGNHNLMSIYTDLKYFRNQDVCKLYNY